MFSVLSPRNDENESRARQRGFMTSTAKRRSHTAARIDPPLLAQLNSYRVAASAAGVAIIACACPAEAAPICGKIALNFSDTGSYSFNPANQPISPFIVAQTYNNLSSHSHSVELRGFFTPNAPSAQAVLGTSGSPANLNAGAIVGSTAKFGKGNSYGKVFQFQYFSGVTGPFRSGHPGFVGFKFSQGGHTHYGWLRLMVNLRSQTNYYPFMSISGYGYESSPNTAIAAGSCGTSAASPVRTVTSDLRMAEAVPTLPSAESGRVTPVSLGILALGSEGLLLWRERSD